LADGNRDSNAIPSRIGLLFVFSIARKERAVIANRRDARQIRERIGQKLPIGFGVAVRKARVVHLKSIRLCIGSTALALRFTGIKMAPQHKERDIPGYEKGSTGPGGGGKVRK
jgi:hypothetical protein